MIDFSPPLLVQTDVFPKGKQTIYVPRILDDGKHVHAKRRMNRQMIEATNELIARQVENATEDSFAEMIGTFELKTNERNVLSVTFSNYAIEPFAAHGMTYMNARTFQTETGKMYVLSDLFKHNSDYVTILSEEIKRQIEVRDIPVIEPFSNMDENASFYIADMCLVIFLQLYELAPYYYGFPMFPISLYSLSNVIDENSPLAAMM
ncbi:MAG TPA: RsiV family protein [Pseudogracilibacillus sp.]|nr:RsiV family protein [Pseudogracilibacillus sp.]